jgi:hypothetical protein
MDPGAQGPNDALCTELRFDAVHVVLPFEEGGEYLHVTNILLTIKLSRYNFKISGKSSCSKNGKPNSKYGPCGYQSKWHFGMPISLLLHLVPLPFPAPEPRLLSSYKAQLMEEQIPDESQELVSVQARHSRKQK